MEEKERVNSNLAQKTSRQQQEISELQRSYSKLENAFSIQKTRSHEQVETISSAKFQLSETKKECASLNEQLQMHIAESSQLQVRKNPYGTCKQSAETYSALRL